jgi:Mlc titration factor MtfA (ptsG expression regulator)
MKLILLITARHTVMTWLAEIQVLGFRKWRRQRLLASAMPPAWLGIVERNVPYYDLLPGEQKRQLQGLTQIFLDEKYFEGCGGLALTDEIRVTIAAEGCVLLLGRVTDIYPKLRSVLVYPHAYVAEVAARQPDGTVVEGWQGRLGESWTQGYVVLSWEDVLHGIARIHEGRNVVLHEFAHQLDNESGTSEGAPLLPESSMYADWARVLGAEYKSLCDSVERGETTFLDPYGTVSPAEFFAVATEFFFELPMEMERRHAELYEQLRRFYKQDPARYRQRTK